MEVVANEKNLECGKTTRFRSGEEAARNGRKGGQASGAARRRKKSLKEAADLYLSLPVTDKRRLNKLKRRVIFYARKVVSALWQKENINVGWSLMGSFSWKVGPETA